MKKRTFIAALMMVGTMQSFAQMPYNNVWVKAQVVNENSGTVFTQWYIPDDDADYIYGATSEFKRSANLAASQGYIWAEPASGWQLGGFAHDYNKNGVFDNDVTVDKQVWVQASGLFNAVYDPTEYKGKTSDSEGMKLAENALAEMTAPTDLIFVVFTKGTIVRHQEGHEVRGRVWINKLDNAAGDQLKLEAYGDSWSNPITSKIEYYKFQKWTKKGDSSFESTEKVLEITAEEGAVYYANFEKTTKAECDAERASDPHKEEYQTSGDIPGLGIQSVKTNATSTPVFDLQGRRVAKATKGIFIQNGKKVVVK